MSESEVAKRLLTEYCENCQYYYKPTMKLYYQSGGKIVGESSVAGVCRYENDQVKHKGWAWPYESLPEEKWCEKWEKKNIQK